MSTKCRPNDGQFFKQHLTFYIWHSKHLTVGVIKSKHRTKKPHVGQHSVGNTIVCTPCFQSSGDSLWRVLVGSSGILELAALLQNVIRKPCFSPEGETRFKKYNWRYSEMTGAPNPFRGWNFSRLVLVYTDADIRDLILVGKSLTRYHLHKTLKCISNMFFQISKHFARIEELNGFNCLALWWNPDETLPNCHEISSVFCKFIRS